MQTAVKVENLSVYYGNLCALSNINLTVMERDFLAVMGPNGGGKTTLLKVILGLLNPSDGFIRVFGRSPEKPGTLIGYVPQFSRFDKSFPISVKEVVLSGRLKGSARLFHRFSKDDMEIVKSIMDKLDIYSLRDRQIGQLSGGQLQRVLIARALAVEPRILFLDEPTANVDTGSKAQIYEILKDLNKEMTIVVVTHDLGTVSSYIKTLACLNRQLHYHGEPELTSSIVKKVYNCPIDLIAHGVPHRVLDEHKEEKNVKRII